MIFTWQQEKAVVGDQPMYVSTILLNGVGDSPHQPKKD